MSLVFTGGDTDKVDFGTTLTGTANWDVGSLLAWVYPTTFTAGAGRELCHRGTGTAFRVFSMSSLNRLRFNVARVTTALIVEEELSQVPGAAINTWNCWAVTWNTGGANGDQHIYGGNLTTPLVEVSAYTTQQVGSGATGDNSAESLIIGNHPTSSSSFAGRIALIIGWNRQLTIGELKDQQFSPHVTSGCVLYSHLGYAGTGAQANWAGIPATGTVTGATQGIHAPLRPTFSVVRRVAVPSAVYSGRGVGRGIARGVMR